MGKLCSHQLQESVGCVYILRRSVYIDLVLSVEPLGLSVEQGDTITVDFYCLGPVKCRDIVFCFVFCTDGSLTGDYLWRGDWEREREAKGCKIICTCTPSHACMEGKVRDGKSYVIHY